MTEAAGRTALYRIRGEADVLLYIGITEPGVPIRWNQHQLVQPWWDELRSLTVEWYDSREAAAAAEKAAIMAEQPKYNVTYLKPGRGHGQRKESKPRPVLPEVMLEPRPDDDDLVSHDDIAVIIRTYAHSVGAALRDTGGPEGFKLGGQRLYHKGEIRRWIAAVELSQKKPAPVPEPVAVAEPPKPKKKHKPASEGVDENALFDRDNVLELHPGSAA